MSVQPTWCCSPHVLAVLGPHPGSLWCSTGHSRWVRVPCFSREGGQTGGAPAGLLVLTSEPGDSHLCLGLLPQGKSWVMEPLPIAQPQGVADRVLGGGCVCVPSLKKAPFVSGQLLHVAIVCAGHNASRDVVTLVKSILFHR